MHLLILNFGGKLLACLLGLSSPGAALALWFLPDVLLAYHLFVLRSGGLVRMQRHFSTSHREVWLTIDDGPDPEDTPRILELLARHEARATFFVIGRRAAAHPELIRAIVAGGHEVGHHTHTHPLSSFWCALPRRLHRELDDATAALRTSAGATPTRFRPPAGHRNIWLRSALRARELTCVGWSARGMERWHACPEAVAAHLTRHLAPGAILLLHEGPSVPGRIRVRAIDLTLRALAARGYRCVIPAPATAHDARPASGAFAPAKIAHPTTAPSAAPAAVSRTTC